MDHPVLGPLEADGGEWRGTVRGCALVVSPDDATPQDAIAYAAALVERWPALVARAQAVAEKSVRESYNADWRFEHDGTVRGPELDAPAFRARLVPEQLTVTGTGCVELWFADRELFWGHSVFAQFFDLDIARPMEEAQGHGELFG